MFEQTASSRVTGFSSPRSCANLHPIAVLEDDGRSGRDLVALFDAVADLDLGSEVANFW